MNFETMDIYYLLASYTFVVVAFISALIYGTHVCPSYKEYKNYYYPAKKTVTLIFVLMGIFGLPYLLNIHSNEALFYSCMFGLVFYPPASTLGLEGYFFFRPFRTVFTLLLILPSFLLIGTMAIDICLSTHLLTEYRKAFSIACYTIYAVQMGFLIQTACKLLQKLQQLAKMQYSNEEDFSIQFARHWLFVPLLWGIFLLIVAICDNRELLMLRDCTLSVLCLALVCSGIYPYRHNVPAPSSSFPIEEDVKKEIMAEKQNNIQKQYRLTPEQQRALEERVISIIRDRQLYRQSNLKIEDISTLISTNNTYIYEALSTGKAGTFYQIVNRFRVEYCMEQMRNIPGIRQEELAQQAGFNSRSTYWRVFKQMTGKSPTEWLKSGEK